MASPDLSLGDGSPTGILSGVTNFIQGGGSAINVFTAMVVGGFAAIFLGAVRFIQAVAAFFAIPFEEVGQTMAALAGAFFQAPAGIIQTGARVSEQFLLVFLGPSVASAAAFPVAIGIVLAGLLLITWYLEEPETSDTLPLPGFPDIPDLGPLTLGVEEEDEDQDEEVIG